MNTKENKEPKHKNHYLNKKTLLDAVIESKKQGKMTDELAKLLMLLVQRYSRKGAFVNYSYIDDMCSYALMMLVRTWKSFDPEKSNNPFSYFTQCIHHSFVQQLNIEKKQRNIRDLLLVDQGLSPSYKFTEECSDFSWSDKEESETDSEDICSFVNEEKFQESDDIEDTETSLQGFRI